MLCFISSIATCSMGSPAVRRKPRSEPAPLRLFPATLNFGSSNLGYRCDPQRIRSSLNSRVSRGRANPSHVRLAKPLPFPSGQPLEDLPNGEFEIRSDPIGIAITVASRDCYRADGKVGRKDDCSRNGALP